jgi:ABC-type transport system involved in multi-copper enzyme maturation permease subunit
VTASTLTRPEVAVSPVSQVRVLTSEWVKLRSLRSSAYTLLAGFVAMILLGCVVGWATNSHWSRIDPEERAHFSPIDSSLAGYHLAQLAIVVLGVLLITGEYATGMVRATFGAVPTRLPVLWAKAVLFAGVTFVVTVVAAVLAFVGGQHFLASHGTSLSATHAVRDVLGVALYLTLIGVLAVACGFVVRSTAGGIAALFGLLLVLPGIGQVLPTSWQRHTLPYLPSNAGASIFTEHTDPGMLTPGPGLLVLAIWVVAALALAAVLLNRRDA